MKIFREPVEWTKLGNMKLTWALYRSLQLLRELQVPNPPGPGPRIPLLTSAQAPSSQAFTDHNRDPADI